MDLKFKWFKYSKYNIPPQGLKILCFTKGDMYVAQVVNFKEKDYWIPIPFTDSVLAKGHIEPPEYWMYVEFPEDYKGYLHVSVDGSVLMKVDDLQRIYPENHANFAQMLIESVGKPFKPKKKK